ncbi:MAG: hypothetical protein WD075_10875 [Rhodospirillales bacterium]
MLRLLALLIPAVFIVLIGISLPVQNTEAAERCVRLIRQGNIETLINTCDVCRVASIIRSRPGNEVPVGREINVQARSDFPVPFKGPGRSRIKAERACPGEAGAPKDLMTAFDKPESEPKCVSMERADTIGIVLVNRCGECRAVAIERVAGGGNSSRDYMALAGGASMPVASNGYTRVGLLAEIACP